MSKADRAIPLRERRPELASEASLDLSLVVPVYNEADVLDRFFAEIADVLRGVIENYEIICVNDGSSDTTPLLLMEHRRREPRIKVVHFSRNFGKEQAVSAGLALSRGHAVIPIDADLQDPPALIPRMIETWREGYDVVYGLRADRGDSFVKRTTSRLFWRCYNRLAPLQIPEEAGDFRLMSRRVTDAVNQMPEKNRFMKGLFAYVGYKTIGIAYRRPARAAGATKWNYWKLWNFALDGITGFSTVPLRVWSYFGLLVSSIALLYALFLIVRTWASGVDVPGYSSLMVVILFLSGVQLITLGIVGEYVGRIFQEIKGRPSYIIESKHGFDDEP